jgi:hypothetical protein
MPALAARNPVSSVRVSGSLREARAAALDERVATPSGFRLAALPRIDARRKAQPMDVAAEAGTESRSKLAAAAGGLPEGGTFAPAREGHKTRVWKTSELD